MSDLKNMIMLLSGSRDLNLPTYEWSVLPEGSQPPGAELGVYEGTPIQFILTTTNLPDGHQLNYHLRQTNGITPGDFSDPSVVSGQLTITNNQASVIVTPILEFGIEGTYTEDGAAPGSDPDYEEVHIVLTDLENNILNSTAHKRIYNSNLTITTSIPGTPDIMEGDSFDFIINTQYVPDGTKFGYVITGVQSVDIANAPLTGEFTIVNNTASLTIQTSDDSITEAESVTITVHGVTHTQSIFLVDQYAISADLTGPQGFTVGELDWFKNAVNADRSIALPSDIVPGDTDIIAGVGTTIFLGGQDLPFGYQNSTGLTAYVWYNDSTFSTFRLSNINTPDGQFYTETLNMPYQIGLWDIKYGYPAEGIFKLEMVPQVRLSAFKFGIFSKLLIQNSGVTFTPFSSFDADTGVNVEYVRQDQSPSGDAIYYYLVPYRLDQTASPGYHYNPTVDFFGVWADNNCTDGFTWYMSKQNDVIDWVKNDLVRSY